MNYSTYISAAEKLSSFGQKQKALLFIKHANDLEKKKIDDFLLVLSRLKEENSKFCLIF